MKRTQLTAAIAGIGLSVFAVSSCVLKDDPTTNLGDDLGGGKGGKSSSNGSSILPRGSGASAPSSEGEGAGGQRGVMTPAPGEGGQSTEPDPDPEGSAGEGSTGIEGLASIPNAEGSTFESSFFILPCRRKQDHACLTHLGACPNAGDPDFSKRGFQSQQDFRLGGKLGKTYDVTIQVNGVVEGKNYVNGVRRAGNEVPPEYQTAQNDAFYTGGEPVESTYLVYRLSVLEPDGETEVQHYFLNSFPNPLYESHQTYLISYQATIRVPGQGVVRYRNEDVNCQVMDNCGPGDIAGDVCNSPRNVPNEPASLALPSTFGGEPLSELAAGYPGATNQQPWHAQLVHVRVTNVAENP